MCSPVLLCETLHVVVQECAHGIGGHQRDVFRAVQNIDYRLSFLFVFFIFLWFIILILLVCLFLMLPCPLLLLMLLTRMMGSKGAPPSQPASWPVAAVLEPRPLTHIKGCIYRSDRQTTLEAEPVALCRFPESCVPAPRSHRDWSKRCRSVTRELPWAESLAPRGAPATLAGGG